MKNEFQFSVEVFSITTLSITILSIMPVYILTLSKTLRNTTLSITALSKITVNITRLIVMTLSKKGARILTIGIKIKHFSKWPGIKFNT